MASFRMFPSVLQLRQNAKHVNLKIFLALFYFCPITGLPSSKYVVYVAASVYRELYGKITDHKKDCLNNYLI